MPYMESVNAKDGLIGSIDQISEFLFSQIYTACGNEEKIAFVGWSFGGVIAFDIASKHTLKWFCQYLQCLKDCSLKLNLSLVGVVCGDKVLEDLFAQCKSKGVFDERAKLVSFRKVFRYFFQGLMRNNSLITGYQPKPYEGNLPLIRAKQGLLLRFKWIRHMGWKNLVSKLTIKSLNYDHYQVVSGINAVSQAFICQRQYIRLENNMNKNSICGEITT